MKSHFSGSSGAYLRVAELLHDTNDYSSKRPILPTVYFVIELQGTPSDVI